MTIPSTAMLETSGPVEVTVSLACDAWALDCVLGVLGASVGTCGDAVEASAAALLCELGVAFFGGNRSLAVVLM